MCTPNLADSIRCFSGEFRIGVDKNGECYCPFCSVYLNIIQDAKHVGERHFFCNKCNSVHHPYLENEKYIGAPTFHAFQKKNPQTELTSEIFHSHVDAYH